ncbi:MAG: HAD-IB family phosphatase [Planctomycetota bacterium]|nr:HAD-IB family phosphatase [Planctomycetota bacterium]
MTAPPPFASVYFDCDSTLSAIEGVDELITFAPPELAADIADLTRRAMDGELPLAQVYESRLAALSPRRDQLEQVGRVYCERVTEHARELVAALRTLGKEVGIVSGGLLPPVQVLAQHLGIDQDRVHAVPIQFDDDGNYRDFDRTSPLWQNHGKVEVLRQLPDEQRPVAFVGDGVTDLEVQGTAADLFVGYGGTVARAAVKEQAEAWFETRSLAPALRWLLTDAERRTLGTSTEFASLLSAARS